MTEGEGGRGVGVARIKKEVEYVPAFLKEQVHRTRPSILLFLGRMRKMHWGIKREHTVCSLIFVIANRWNKERLQRHKHAEQIYVHKVKKCPVSQEEQLRMTKKQQRHEHPPVSLL